MANDNQVKRNGRPPKFDYDSDEFYDEIFTLAFQGLVDAEIADALYEKFHQSIAPATFNDMINGRYPMWSEEDNEKRSKRLKGVLERARRKINSIVRGRYLEAALGGIKTKNVTTVTRRMRIDGVLTDDEDIQTSVTETESAPNIQALAVWLHHHDKEWRKKEGIVEEDYADNNIDPQGVPTNIERGIDIASWIDKEVTAKEMMDDNKIEE